MRRHAQGNEVVVLVIIPSTDVLILVTIRPPVLPCPATLDPSALGLVDVTSSPDKFMFHPTPGGTNYGTWQAARRYCAMEAMGTGGLDLINVQSLADKDFMIAQSA